MEEDTTIKPKRNFFIRLLNGDIPLPVTYWVFGFLIGNVLFRIIFFAIERNYTAIVLSKHGLTYINVIIYFSLAYSFAILVATWRSATNYNKSEFWANAAKGTVVLGFLLLGKTLLDVYKSRTNYIESIKAELPMLQQSLPMMVDEITRFDQVKLQDKELIYTYTIINAASTDYDKQLFKDEAKKILVDGCGTTVDLGYLKFGGSYTFSYFGIDELLIADISISESDCF